jgi:hypothetical protein
VRLLIVQSSYSRLLHPYTILIPDSFDTLSTNDFKSLEFMGKDDGAANSSFSRGSSLMVKLVLFGCDTNRLTAVWIVLRKGLHKTMGCRLNRLNKGD